MFLFYVNDLLFADDVKIISPRSQYDDKELSFRTAWNRSVIEISL